MSTQPTSIVYSEKHMNDLTPDELEALEAAYAAQFAYDSGDTSTSSDDDQKDPPPPSARTATVSYSTMDPWQTRDVRAVLPRLKWLGRASTGRRRPKSKAAPVKKKVKPPVHVNNAVVPPTEPTGRATTRRHSVDAAVDETELSEHIRWPWVLPMPPDWSELVIVAREQEDENKETDSTTVVNRDGAVMEVPSKDLDPVKMGVAPEPLGVWPAEIPNMFIPTGSRVPRWQFAALALQRALAPDDFDHPHIQALLRASETVPGHEAVVVRQLADFGRSRVTPTVKRVTNPLVLTAYQTEYEDEKAVDLPNSGLDALHMRALWGTRGLGYQHVFEYGNEKDKLKNTGEGLKQWLGTIFAKMQDLPESQQPGGIIFYYSGHGNWKSAEDSLGQLEMGKKNDPPVGLSGLTEVLKEARESIMKDPTWPIVIIMDSCRGETPNGAAKTEAWQSFLLGEMAWSPTHPGHPMRQQHLRLQAENILLVAATQNLFASADRNMPSWLHMGGMMTRTLFANARQALERHSAPDAEFPLDHVLFRTLCCTPAYRRHHRGWWDVRPFGQMPMLIGGFHAPGAEGRPQHIKFVSSREVPFNSFMPGPVHARKRTMAGYDSSDGSAHGEEEEEEEGALRGGRRSRQWRKERAYLRQLRRDQDRLLREQDDLRARLRATRHWVDRAVQAAAHAPQW